MSKKAKTAITPTREEDFASWYQQVIKQADLAEHSAVRGCMVIKPWGFGIWENMQKVLDQMFKKTGHENAYFPLFIPLSYLEKEAKHVQGFAKECAVVTHHRLQEKEGKLIPEGELEEPLIVRPTSEMIIGETFAKWVQSYRDLPILMNQWANVVRWELRTRMFLRTSEFLWQEGHTVHATKEEAIQETLQMLDVYEDFCHHYLAMPVIKGIKTESEKFPGAETTYSIEAMMQDKKALQAGTSHFLGQNFSKSSDITFLDEAGKLQHAWTTSWGVSTRLIGGLIMTHSDDDGLVIPPKLSPKHVVILPVIHKEESKAEVLQYCYQLKRELEDLKFDDRAIEVVVDVRDIRGGEKKWAWVKKGIPIRVEIGPKDIASDTVFVGRRDLSTFEAKSISKKQFVAGIVKLLHEMQNNLFNRAMKFRDENLIKIDSKADFYDFFKTKNHKEGEIHSGFALCHSSLDPKMENKLKEDLGVTIRCIPLEYEKEEGVCPFSGKKSLKRVIFAQAY